MEKSVFRVPFVRVDNQKLRSVSNDSASHVFSSLSDLGLYMMISGVLSNPSFVSAAGGLQNLLLRHCRNRYFSLHASWNRLVYSGYLKRTRMPIGHNRFHDAYTLSSAADPVHAAVVHLSFEEGRTYRECYQPFIPPCEDFTAVSYPMLMDERLSLSAKGLYAVLARLIRLSEYQPSLVVSKALLRPLCGEGKNALDALLRELRLCGYLSLLRGWDPDAGKIRFVYCLNPAGNRTVSDPAAADADCSDPDGNAVVRTCSADTEKTDADACSSVSESDAGLRICSDPVSADPRKNSSRLYGKAELSVQGHKQNGERGGEREAVLRDSRGRRPDDPPAGQMTVMPPAAVRSMEEIRKEIRDAIEYPVLLQEYTKEKLDAVVSILAEAKRGASVYPDRTDTIGGETVPKREFWDRCSQLDSEDIRFVLDSFRDAAKTTRIRRVRRYLTACLYHAKENMALALEVFSDHLQV